MFFYCIFSKLKFFACSSTPSKTLRLSGCITLLSLKWLKQHSLQNTLLIFYFFVLFVTSVWFSLIQWVIKTLTFCRSFVFMAVKGFCFVFFCEQTSLFFLLIFPYSWVTFLIFQVLQNFSSTFSSLQMYHFNRVSSLIFKTALDFQNGAWFSKWCLIFLLRNILHPISHVLIFFLRIYLKKYFIVRVFLFQFSLALIPHHWL